MKYIKSRVLVPKIIVVLICFFIVGMKIIIPLLMHTYEKNNWSLKYISRAIDDTRYEDDLIPPPEGHINASLWLARDAVKSNKTSLTYSLIEPFIILKDPFALSILGDALMLEEKTNEAIEIWAGIGDVFSLSDYAKNAEERGDLVTAVDVNKTILTFDPNNSMVYFKIGKLKAKQNKYPEADRWFQQAIALDPKPGWQLIRARVAKEAGNLTLSQIVYEELISQSLEPGPIYFEIAWVYYLDQNLSQAESSIESALQLMPFPRAIFYLRAGRIYEEGGKIEKAINAYQNVLSIDPKNKSAMNQLKNLR